MREKQSWFSEKYRNMQKKEYIKQLKRWVFDEYKHRLQIYKTLPNDTISLKEFEDHAVEKLKILKAVETAGDKFIRSAEKYEINSAFRDM